MRPRMPDVAAPLPCHPVDQGFSALTSGYGEIVSVSVDVRENRRSREHRGHWSPREGRFSILFWEGGFALWFVLAIAFGLHRQWDYFGLSVLWVLASMTGWSHEKHLRV
jgi:hypothetical protein